MIKELKIKEKLKEKENIMDMWALDLKAITDNKRFDQYSRRGKKKIDKLSKKYAPMLVQVDREIEELEKEEEES